MLARDDCEQTVTARRGAAPNMTRAQIVDAAEMLARSEGLENVTVRRLSASLSVTAPALYWHLNNKSELVSEIVDRALGRVERPDPDAGTWLERLVLFYGSLRDVFIQYPGISSVLMTRQPSKASLENSLFVIDLLIEGGFDEDRAVAVFNALLMLAHGHLAVVDTYRVHERVAAGEGFAVALSRLREDAGDYRGLDAFERSM